PLDRAGRRPDRIRLPHEATAGVLDNPGAGGRVCRVRPRRLVGAHPAPAGRRGSDHRVRRVVGRCCAAHPAVGPAVHRRGAASVGRWARCRHVLAAAAAIIVSAGWWVAAVRLTRPSDRPYIGGSQHNSILELTFGYNGFGRLTGDETGSVGGGPGNTGGMWG